MPCYFRTIVNTPPSASKITLTPLAAAKPANLSSPTGTTTNDAPTTSEATSTEPPTRPSSAASCSSQSSAQPLQETPPVAKIRKSGGKSNPISNEMLKIQKQISATGEAIQSMLSTKPAEDKPKTNDELFGHMIALELTSMPDSYQKGMLKLEIQRRIMEAKYGQAAASQPSNDYSFFGC